MTPEESHVILAARNVYWAGRNGLGVKEALSELAKACAALEASERKTRSKRDSGIFRAALK